MTYFQPEEYAPSSESEDKATELKEMHTGGCTG
jgi:hypothetical protein